MPSWRDTASQQAQDDLDALLNASLPFAQQMLDKRGEFFPFGASISMGGEIRMLAGDPGQGENPASTEVLPMLVQGVRLRREDLRAVSLVCDVRLSDADAVRVELEHREGQGIAVLLPYKKKRLGRGVDYLVLRAGAAAPQIWDRA